jgi:hypothetical protein
MTFRAETLAVSSELTSSWSRAVRKKKVFAFVYFEFDLIDEFKSFEECE